MIDEIIIALLLTHPSDIGTIKRYVAWVKFRRRIHNQFYPAVHWVRSSQRAHWIGSINYLSER